MVNAPVDYDRLADLCMRFVISHEASKVNATPFERTKKEWVETISEFLGLHVQLNEETNVKTGAFEFRFNDDGLTCDIKYLETGEIIHVTGTESVIMRLFAENLGKSVPYASILRRGWSDEFIGEVHYLRVWISRLRKKLAEYDSEREYLRTLNGIGYMLVEYK